MVGAERTIVLPKLGSRTSAPGRWNVSATPHLILPDEITVLPLPYVSITALSRPNGPGA